MAAAESVLSSKQLNIPQGAKPTGADHLLAQRIYTLFGDAKAKRHPRVERWNRAYRLVHNQGWSPMREGWMPSPQASEIYPIVAAMAGWMTDQRPGINALPYMNPGTPDANQLQNLARDIETCLRAIWTSYDWDAEVEKVLWDAMMYGTGFFKVTWAPALGDGKGDVSLHRIDPFAIYPDPNCTSFEDAQYIIEARRMSLQELDRRFPGTAKKLRDREFGAGDNLEQRDDLFGNTGKAPMANTAAISPVTAPLWGLPGGNKQKVDNVFRDDGITVYECWLREHKVVQEDDGVAHLYDQWRVVIVAADMVLLDEKSTDLYKHGQHPYVRYVLNELGDFWGISLVDHLAPLQVSLNRLLAALQSNAELAGNPIFLEDSASGIPRTRIVNRPGQRLTVNRGSEVQWLNPPDMAAGVSDLVKFYIGEMERVSGLSAMVRGATPQGRNAQGVMDSVQEAAFVRVRLALRSLERTLRGVGQLAASLFTDFYTQPRIVAIVGAHGEQTSLTLGSRHFHVTDITTGKTEPLRFTILIQAGSSTPISRQQRSAEAMQLFAMGGIDILALLDAFDYPNRTEIAQRVMQAQAAGISPPGARQRAGH